MIANPSLANDLDAAFLADAIKLYKNPDANARRDRIIVRLSDPLLSRARHLVLGRLASLTHRGASLHDIAR